MHAFTKTPTTNSYSFVIFSVLGVRAACGFFTCLFFSLFKHSTELTHILITSCLGKIPVCFY